MRLQTIGDISPSELVVFSKCTEQFSLLVNRMSAILESHRIGQGGSQILGDIRVGRTANRLLYAALWLRRVILRVDDRLNRVLARQLPVKHNRLWLWLSSNTIGCVCRRAGYAWNEQGGHCDTIVFS